MMAARRVPYDGRKILGPPFAASDLRLAEADIFGTLDARASSRLASLQPLSPEDEEYLQEFVEKFDLSQDAK